MDGVTNLVPHLPGHRGTHVWLSQAGGAGAQDDLGAVRHLQLADNVRDLVAHGLGAEDEARGDLRVFRTLGEQLEDFALALA